MNRHNTNRLGITLRFNKKEQDNLRSLCEFWRVDEKQVLKLAFDQLVVASNQMNKKLTEADDVAKKYDDATSSGSDNGNGDSSDQSAAATNAPTDSSSPADGVRNEGSNDVGTEDVANAQ